MRLERKTVEDILDWARRYPGIEVTGFVKRGLVSDVEVVVPMQNVHPEPAEFYRWDDEEMREQFNRMDIEHSEPILYYHSHPSGKSDPSDTDMRAAMNVGLVYAIAYPDTKTLTAESSPRRIRVVRWNLSLWRCLEPGILVSEQLGVVP